MKVARLNDEGVNFLLTVRNQDNEIIDLSAVTVKKFLFRKPNNSILEVVPDFDTDGTDGVLSYYTVTSDLDVIGIWEVQVYIENSEGNYHSGYVRFRVGENIA